MAPSAGKKEKSVQGTQKKQQKGSSIMMQICLKDTEAAENAQPGIAPYACQNPFDVGHEQKQQDFLLMHQMQQLPESQAAPPATFFHHALGEHQQFYAQHALAANLPKTHEEDDKLFTSQHALESDSNSK